MQDEEVTTRIDKIIKIAKNHGEIITPSIKKTDNKGLKLVNNN